MDLEVWLFTQFIQVRFYLINHWAAGAQNKRLIMILTHQQLTVPTLTSCDVNGTSIPMPPDRVVYTRDSEPPGISVAFCSDITTSPMWKLMTTSACKNIHRYTARLKTTRDVRNRFYYFGSFFFEKLNSVRNEFGSVKKCSSVWMLVIYYSCNSWVVNLQQILQRQWMTRLWRHSQRQQVNNVTAL